jgi:hypothetical protein
VPCVGLIINKNRAKDKNIAKYTAKYNGIGEKAKRYAKVVLAEMKYFKNTNKKG